MLQVTPSYVWTERKVNSLQGHRNQGGGEGVIGHHIFSPSKAPSPFLRPCITGLKSPEGSSSELPFRIDIIIKIKIRILNHKKWTYFAWRTRAKIPAAKGADAEVPVWPTVHSLFTSVVAYEFRKVLRISWIYLITTVRTVNDVRKGSSQEALIIFYITTDTYMH